MVRRKATVWGGLGGVWGGGGGGARGDSKGRVFVAEGAPRMKAPERCG